MMKQQDAQREREDLLKLIETNRRQEEELAIKNKEKHMNYQQDLRSQIQHNDNLAREQFERDEQEYFKGMQAEREYQGRLKACLDNPEYEKVHPMRRALAKQ